MSYVCVLEPQPDRSDLRLLCQAAGLADDLVVDATIRQVFISPERNSWRIDIDTSSNCDGAMLAKIESSLAKALGLSKVELARSGDSEEGDPEGGRSSPSMADDEEYMESLIQRIEEARNGQESEEDSGQDCSGVVLLGKMVAQDPQPIKSIQDEERSAVVRGEVIALDIREMRSGRRLVSFDITDHEDSIGTKVFAEENEDWMDRLRTGLWLIARGAVQYDKYTQELTLLPRDLMITTSPPGRQDLATVKRIELHLHTKMSALDGVADVEAIVAQVKTWGHEAVAITDHGVVQAFPEAFAAGRKHGVKILYGVEAYLTEHPAQNGPTFHTILLARTTEGIHQLYQLISMAHIDYFYRRPRVPRAELEKLREHLLVGSACEAGELYQAILTGMSTEEIERVARFYDYLEIQPLGNNRFFIDAGRVPDEDALRDINRQIVALGRRLNKPVVATSDAHYVNPQDDIYRRILMAGHGFRDTENMAPLYLRNTEEMLEEFAYLGAEEAYRVVVEDTHRVAAMIDELQPIPDGFYPPHLPGAEEEIRRMCDVNARRLYGDPVPQLVADRLKEELDSIIGNGFASLYLIAHKLVKQSVDEGYLVGSRGSVGSSLVATFCGISEVNPLPPHYVCVGCGFCEAVEDGSVGTGTDLPAMDCPTCGRPLRRDGFDIPFETFLGFDGVGKTPDIDLNFSGEYQPRAHKFTEEIFGKDHVYRAGTIGSLAQKTAYGYVRKYLDEKGLQVRSAEVGRLALGITGVRRTTGQHPGGVMVVPQGRNIWEFTPIQYPANDRTSGVITTHFAYTYVHDQLVKLDILGHDGPTMIRLLEDMTGVKAAQIPLDDPSTMSLFSAVDALGVGPKDAGGTVGTLALPEYNTRFVRQMLEDTRPQTFADLVRIMGLSHGTDVWLNNAQDLVRQGVITLAETIACRDDIMIYLIRRGIEAGRAFHIMEQVRKGKGLSTDEEALMLEHGIPRWYIDSCRKISYLFPKAHAAAYAVMAFWQAFFKVHYPVPFYAAYFSVRASSIDADLVIQGRKAVQETLRRLDDRGTEATGKEKGMMAWLEVVLEAMARGVSFLPVDLYSSDVRRFQVVDQALLPPLVSLDGVGESAAESLDAARTQRPFTSVEDLRKRSGVSRAVIDVLANHGALKGLPESDQLTLF